MNLGISSSKFVSIVFLLATILLALALSSVPFLIIDRPSALPTLEGLGEGLIEGADDDDDEGDGEGFAEGNTNESYLSSGPAAAEGFDGYNMNDLKRSQFGTDASSPDVFTKSVLPSSMYNADLSRRILSDATPVSAPSSELKKRIPSTSIFNSIFGSSTPKEAFDIMN
jgi:hypothetical protein